MLDYIVVKNRKISALLVNINIR